MGNGLVLVGDELDLVVVRQIGHANRLAEFQLADIGFDASRNVGGQALDLDLAHHLLEDAALHLHAMRFALERDRHADAQQLVHGNALQIDVQQRALDGLELPVHDHRLARVSARGQIENRVVARFRIQDAAHLFRIDGDVQRFQAGAVQHGWDEPALADAARVVLGAALPRLGFYVLFWSCCRHNFVSFTKTVC